MNKKGLFGAILLVAVFYNLSFAQNSITVTQKGRGNTAVITQSADTDTPATGILNHQPCYETKSNVMKTDQNIIVLKTNDGSGKQVYKITGRKDNKLYLSQQGNSAETVIGVWESLDSVAAVQRGEDNKIVLTLKDPPSSDPDGDAFDFTQKGNSNFIYVGPCGEYEEQKNDANSTIKIHQKGEDNTAVIKQG